jgi:prepilin-type processing-associated H-X9-DG protein
MSNELSTPKLLVCPGDAFSPGDTSRVCATDFSGLSNSNISYFVGVDVTNDLNPQMIISGDCNFEIGGVPVKSGLRSFWTNDPVTWSAARHVGRGNIGLADGSVQSTISTTLQNYLQQTGLATNRFAIP